MNKPLHILEVNCGTGEDALRFAQAGHRVVATDISGEMIRVCEHKAQHRVLAADIEFKQTGFHEISKLADHDTFDLIFSNFGGLNCISPTELSRFMQQASTLLKPEGSLVAVIMPPFCLWETGYFLFKNSFRKAFRRLANKPQAVIKHNQIPVYYYHPYALSGMHKKAFELVKLAPIGLFLPPSYLEHFFSNRQKLLVWLAKLENICSPLSALSCVSDHYYIQLKKRP